MTCLWFNLPDLFTPPCHILFVYFTRLYMVFVRLLEFGTLSCVPIFSHLGLLILSLTAHYLFFEHLSFISISLSMWMISSSLDPRPLTLNLVLQTFQVGSLWRTWGPTSLMWKPLLFLMDFISPRGSILMICILNRICVTTSLFSLHFSRLNRCSYLMVLLLLILLSIVKWLVLFILSLWCSPMSPLRSTNYRNLYIIHLMLISPL